MSGKQKEHFMFVYTTVLYEYMKSLRNDVHNLLDNVHVPIKIYLKIYNDIVYITNKWRHIRITFIFGWIEQRTREQIQIIVWQMWVDCQGKVKHILYNHLLRQFSNQIPDTWFNVCIYTDIEIVPPTYFETVQNGCMHSIVLNITLYSQLHLWLIFSTSYGTKVY
jgi:hypothetical protein